LEGVGLEGGFDGVAHGAVNEPVDHWWHKGRHPLARVGHDLDLTQRAGFPGGPGRTTKPEDFASLMDDLESRVFGELPNDTWVYPGHGDDTTLGTERPKLAEWRERGW
jgi:hypothetical protein